MVRRVISVTVAAAMAVAVATSAGVAAADTPAPPAPQNHASTSGRAAVDHAPPPLPPVGPYRSVASKSPAPPSNLAAPMGLSAPVSALVADSASGKLPPGQVVRAAAALLSPGIPVPAKYRASRLNDLDVLALIATIGSAGPKLSGKDQANVGSALAGSTLTAPIAVSALAVPTCGAPTLINPFNCQLVGAHVLIKWANSGKYALSASDLADDDGDGVPNLPQATFASMESAWSFNANVLNMQAPSSRIPVLLNHPFANAGASLPRTWLTAAQIWLPGTYTVSYASPHELFHQFQWSYMTAATNMPSLVSLANIQNINWWMEATDEWATHQYRKTLNTHATDEPLEARSVPAFLKDTSSELRKAQGLAGFSGARQYGVMAAVEYFAQRLGPDFVRRSFETLSGKVFLNGDSQMLDVFAGYGADQAQVLAEMYESMNTICDPYPVQANWLDTRLKDPDVANWCARYINTDSDLNSGDPGAGIHRPRHQALDLASTTAVTTTAAAGGATYTDLFLPAGDVSRTVTITTRSTAAGPSLRTVVNTWGDYDDGTRPSPYQTCERHNDAFTADSPSSITLTLDRWCPNLTVINVNGDATSGQSATFTTSWTSTLTSAVISNGLIRLGVNAAGNLIVDDRSESSGGNLGTGLRYLPTNAEALSPGCWCEAWGLAGPADSNPQVSAFADQNLGGLRGGTVQSFSATATEATSVVKVGDYTIKHTYHPSIDPRMYQVDVYVTGPGIFGPPIPYRRTLDFDVEPTPFDELMTIHVDPNDTAITDSTNDGFAWPDPTTPLTDIGGARGSFTDFGPDDQGAAFDFILNPTPAGAPTPQLTMFYGAGRSAADTQAGLTAVGATSWAVGKPSSSPTEGTPNSFAFGYRHGALP